MEFAVERVRRVRSPPSSSNTATIHMRGGTYTLTNTIRLVNSKDSFLSIKNYQAEKVEISGGRSLDLDYKDWRIQITSGGPECNLDCS